MVSSVVTRSELGILHFSALFGPELSAQHFSALTGPELDTPGIRWGSGVENRKGGAHCEVWCWSEDAGTDVIRFRILSSLASCLAKEHSSRSSRWRWRCFSDRPDRLSWTLGNQWKQWSIIVWIRTVFGWLKDLLLFSWWHNLQNLWNWMN